MTFSISIRLNFFTFYLLLNTIFHHYHLARSTKVQIGKECNSTNSCGSNLLFCSTYGVCLCNETVSNLVYESVYHSIAVNAYTPVCEVRECTIGLDFSYNECFFSNSQCRNHPLNNSPSIGYCKCPGLTVGIGVSCRFATIVRYGETCNLNYVCNAIKRLRCVNSKCLCNKGFAFDSVKDKCIKIEISIDTYRATYQRIMLVVVIVIIILIVALAIVVLHRCYKKRKIDIIKKLLRNSQQINSHNTDLVHQRNSISAIVANPSVNHPSSVPRSSTPPFTNKTNHLPHNGEERLQDYDENSMYINRNIW